MLIIIYMKEILLYYEVCSKYLCKVTERELFAYPELFSISVPPKRVKNQRDFSYMYTIFSISV